MCPHGWFDLGPENGCFLFVYDKQMSWMAAHNECELQGGFLAEPKTKQLADILVSIAFVESGQVGAELSWWIGLTDWGHEDRWVWEHTLTDASYTAWAAGAPRQGTNTADCTVMAREEAFLWRDTDCVTTQAAVICQR